MGNDSRSGTETGTETGNKAGNKAGIETGTESGTENGTEGGNEAGTEAGTEFGIETSNKTGNEASTEAGPDPKSGSDGPGADGAVGEQADNMGDDQDEGGAQPWPPPLAGRLADYLRELRHLADLSQRELSARSGITQATIGRLEADVSADPRLSTVSRLVSAAGYRVLICGDDNQPIAPQSELCDVFRDLGGRMLPAHLDVEKARDEQFRLWWEPKRRPFTFTRDRWRRDQRREQNRAFAQRYLAKRYDAERTADG